MILERVQKRYTKMINGCKDKSYEQRLSKVNLTTLAEVNPPGFA